MKAAIKKKWVAALRSGEYKQTKGSLRIGSAFCCLGVLCNLHAQSHPKEAASQTSEDYYFGDSKYLPPEVRDWAGLPANYGALVMIKKRKASLADFNDGGKSFEVIADAIESQL